MRDEYLDDCRSTLLPLQVLSRVRDFVRSLGIRSHMPEMSVGGSKVLVAEGCAPNRVPNVEEATNQVCYAIWTDLGKLFSILSV